MHAPPATVSDHFLADHERLETLLGSVHSALEANDGDRASRLWADCCSGLMTHLDAEERSLIPPLLQRSQRNARVLVQEHRHIRSRLTELSGAMASRLMRADGLRDFVAELRAHSRSEARLLYQWVDAHVDEASGVAAIAGLVPNITATRAKPA
jgi:hypothetical protein